MIISYPKKKKKKWREKDSTDEKEQKKKPGSLGVKIFSRGDRCNNVKVHKPGSF